MLPKRHNLWPPVILVKNNKNENKRISAKQATSAPPSSSPSFSVAGASTSISLVLGVGDQLGQQCSGEERNMVNIDSLPCSLTQEKDTICYQNGGVR
jgi:hypothetical protein